MKTVVSKTDVAHMWANKTQSEAKTPTRNFYFNGDTIYSYGSHFPIAVHYKGIVLFTLNSYSVTTSEHISLTRSACSHLTKLYCLNPENAKGGYHTQNIEYWFKQIKVQFAKLVKATKPQLYVYAINGNIDQLNAYLKFFKAKLTAEQKKLLILATQDTISLKTALKDAIEIENKAKELKLQKAKKAYAEYVDLWHNYSDFKEFSDTKKALSSHYSNTMNGTLLTMLRTNGKEIETSKGIKLPLNVAKRVYTTYLTKVKQGGCIGCGDWKILEYSVTSANDSLLVVGCHSVPRAEINAIATKLQWA